MGGPSCKKEKARGFSVNLKFPIILGLKCKSIQHESCATFQDLQLLYCAKKFTRSTVLKLFWNPLKLLFANKPNLSFKIARAALDINMSFYEGKK